MGGLDVAGMMDSRGTDASLGLDCVEVGWVEVVVVVSDDW